MLILIYFRNLSTFLTVKYRFSYLVEVLWVIGKVAIFIKVVESDINNLHDSHFDIHMFLVFSSYAKQYPKHVWYNIFLFIYIPIIKMFPVFFFSFVQSKQAIDTYRNLCLTYWNLLLI